eukprot:3157315-Rhodomonas_salina.2
MFSFCSDYARKAGWLDTFGIGPRQYESAVVAMVGKETEPDLYVQKEVDRIASRGRERRERVNCRQSTKMARQSAQTAPLRGQPAAHSASLAAMSSDRPVLLTNAVVEEGHCSEPGGRNRTSKRSGHFLLNASTNSSETRSAAQCFPIPRSSILSSSPSHLCLPCPAPLNPPPPNSLALPPSLSLSLSLSL